MDPAGSLSRPLGSITTSDQSPLRKVRTTKESLLLYLDPKLRSVSECGMSAPYMKQQSQLKLSERCRDTIWTFLVLVSAIGPVQSIEWPTMAPPFLKDTHTHGVALIICKEKVKTLIKCEHISESMIRAHFNSKYKLTIIHWYAPTNDDEENVMN